MTESNVTRRGFLQGAGVAAAALATAGMLGGCSSNGDGGATKANEETNGGAASYSPDETMDVDIVVVGSGASGVAATVQAAELGATTLLLEKSDVTGGNGRLTEGMFAIGSQMQKELGVGDGVTFTDIIAAEQEFFNYRINNLLWKDLADASGENIDWMASHGVKFSGVVDDYHGLGKFDCFHWFEEGSGSNYIDPMLESAQKLGAVVMADTPALDLVVENGAVKGLYAEKPDGSILQVNAKAVILTSGGYAQNEETMAERGWDLTYSHNNGVNGHDGDGLRMATSAGAHDVSRERCFLREAYSFGIDFFADMSQTIHRGGPVLWVNQDAERYTNEGCGSFVPQCVGNAVHTQAESYLVMSKDVIDEFVSRTGCDSLAIAIGTSHGAFKFKPGQKPQLRFDILKDVMDRLPGFPIVLHGASSVMPEYVAMVNQFGGEMADAIGIPEDMLREAASMAVCKINVDSDLRLAMTAGIRKHLAENPSHFDPRQYLGDGRQFIHDVVKHKIETVLGSAGKA